MSKANPKAAKVTPVSHPNHVQRVYAVGDKVWFTREGVELPCVVVSSHQTGGKDGVVTYTVQGDISGEGFPAGVASGPFKQVAEDALTDR